MKRKAFFNACKSFAGEHVKGIAIIILLLYLQVVGFIGAMINKQDKLKGYITGLKIAVIIGIIMLILIIILLIFLDLKVRYVEELEKIEETTKETE